MRTVAALVLAFPLLASAQAAPPPDTWVDEPAPSAARPPPEPAPAAPAAAPPAAAPAQPVYPPPPQAAPPAPPQAVPANPQPAAAVPPPAVRPPKTRDRWYIGFGIGGGNGKIASGSQTLTFREAMGDRSPDTTVFNLKVGATLSPKLLLGLDLSGPIASNDSGGLETELVLTTTDAMLTFFPAERGFFMRGGAGIASLSWSIKDSTGRSKLTQDGWNVLGGIGYAFWLGKQFNLTLNLDFARAWFSGTPGADVTDAQYWALWVGFDWY